jgi:hypothetical protein
MEKGIKGKGQNAENHNVPPKLTKNKNKITNSQNP